MIWCLLPQEIKTGIFIITPNKKMFLCKQMRMANRDLEIQNEYFDPENEPHRRILVSQFLPQGMALPTPADPGPLRSRQREVDIISGLFS